MRFMDMLFAFPFILPATGIIAVLGPNFLSAAVGIAIVHVSIFAPLLRSPFLVICAICLIHGFALDHRPTLRQSDAKTPTLGAGHAWGS